MRTCCTSISPTAQGIGDWWPYPPEDTSYDGSPIHLYCVRTTSSHRDSRGRARRRLASIAEGPSGVVGLVSVDASAIAEVDDYPGDWSPRMT